MIAVARIQLQLFGSLQKKGSWWIAHCPPLDVSTQGKTQEEAKKNLVEASQLFVISCLERGTLEQALRETGFVVIGSSASRMVRPQNSFPVEFGVPFGLLQNQNAECRV
jgi:predicted RNase H-like HicB family nuclease